MSESDSSSIIDDPVLEYTDDSSGSLNGGMTLQDINVFSPDDDHNMQFQVQIVVRPMSSVAGNDPNVSVTASTPSPSRGSRARQVMAEKGKSPYVGRRVSSRQLTLPANTVNFLTPGWPNEDDMFRSKSPVAQGRRRSDSYYITNESRRMPNIKVKPQKINGGLNAAANQNGASQESVSAYLKSHPEYLEQWLMEEVELEQLERWMIRKMQRDKKKQQPDSNGKVGRKTSLSRWKFCVHADKRQMLQELTQSLQTKPNRSNVLWELASCICSAVSADGFRLYLADTSDQADNSRGSELTGQYLGHDLKSDNGEPLLVPVSTPTTVAEFVAQSREPLRLSRGSGDQRFPVPSPDAEGKDDSVMEAEHALWQPIVQADSEMSGVLLMWRRQGPAFHEEDEEIARSYLVWGGIALHYAQLFLSIDKTRRLNDFLLRVVKSIFQDMVSMDGLVVKVMTYAQRLVDADRASLFLVDSRNKELYARIFDMGNHPEEGKQPESSTTQQAKEIRFPLGTGIAGQVALTGEVLNIADAYSDPRFNRTVDQLTGYHTKTILCMPVYIRGITIGVVQMVNKRVGCFTKEDEEAFETFAIYCGLALHHAKLYEKIQRSEQKYRVALDVLSYHNTCSEGEVDLMKNMTEVNPEAPSRDATNTALPMDEVGSPSIDVASYYFNIYALDDMQKVRYSVKMFTELFGISRFDQDNIIRFTLTVRKNYRRVPYHNWAHGFSVANSMYSIIKHNKDVFNANECLALYVGSLCHDLDHRGKNNKFMLDTESPLASIYSTSTMEHHHFNQTITILQQEGHNIFSKLSSEEYKHVLSNIKHCILATDLALFFPNKAKLQKIVDEDKFSWNNIEHRLLLEAITMTASDLSASAKPWELQVKTVKVIFQEFYEQGDEEKAAGRNPIPMMDRDQPDQQAASQGDQEKLAGRMPIPLMDRDKESELAEMQVGFINGICIPCYSLLYKLIPETKPLLDQCQANLARWQALHDKQKEKKELAAPKT